jgi:serine protease Do
MKSLSRWALGAICLSLGIGLGAFFSGAISQGQNPSSAGQPRELTSYRDVVKRVLPAVVNIEARAKTRRQSAEPKTRPFSDDAKPDDGDLGFGSGWIASRDGLIVTNYHVVEGADHLIIQMMDGRRFTTDDFISDKKTDLAVVRVRSRQPLPFIPFGDSDAMEIGDRVLAMGSPFGLKGSVTSGIVSAKGRNLHLNMYEDFIQTDAAVNPGNSGGPLVNLEGKVIGMTTAIKSRNGGFQGVGLAVSSNFAKSVMDQLLRDGTVKRGYLGIQMDDVDPDLAERIGLKGSGVLTKRVLPNTPAAKGGIKVGDIIVAIAGKPIKDGHDLQRVVGGLPLQEPTTVTVMRQGKTINLAVTVVEQPENIEPAKR